MDDKVVDVIWKSYHQPEIINRGYWDDGLLEDIFKHAGPLTFKHHDDFDWFDIGEIKEDQPGAVVIINGRTHTEDADKINADIAKLRWVLFIDTGDEESVFPWRDIKHPLMRVWMMLPRMNVHDDTEFKLPNGYRPETHEVLRGIGLQPKTLDYSFAGQINHERRQQCFDVLKQFEPLYKAKVVGTDGFGKEDVPYNTYLYDMAISKVAPCPSGVESPDNFRLYEALEAGCIPVVDAFSTKNKSPGFWKYLLGGDIPFPIIDYWDAFPKILPGLLADHQALSNKCFAWWQLKKREIKYKLYDDVKELSK